jgi:hypothetical protein
MPEGAVKLENGDRKKIRKNQYAHYGVGITLKGGLLKARPKLIVSEYGVSFSERTSDK